MIKIIKWSVLIGLGLSIVVVVFANYIVERSGEFKIYDNRAEIPVNRVGLLLGTSKYLRSGNLNQYFEYRIAATVDLYKAGKIQKIVISGDNSRKDYNEPQDMKDELIKRGVGEGDIYLDYAGFRTYDSVYRMKEIFGQQSFTIISQKFHNQRAIYIANQLNLNAIGFNAKDVDAYNGMKTQIREKFARVKVLIDILIEKKPRFLGDKVLITTMSFCCY